MKRFGIVAMGAPPKCTHLALDMDCPELLALSGPRNPYPGKLGVIEEGAYADLLLINGDPLKNIKILTMPEENLALIMKDGKIYKNTVH